jgi:hypothetical protein
LGIVNSSSLERDLVSTKPGALQGRRAYDTTVAYYEPAPDVYVPPLVVYPPPHPSPGISIVFPIWLHW